MADWKRWYLLNIIRYFILFYFNVRKYILDYNYYPLFELYLDLSVDTQGQNKNFSGEVKSSEGKLKLGANSKF